jgi:hypothetical protein
VIVGVGLLVGRPAGVVWGAGCEGFTAVLLGFGDGLPSGSVRLGLGAAAGALLARKAKMACDDDAAGAPRGVVRAGADPVGLGVDELAGPRLRDAEVLDWDGLAGTVPSGPLGAAAR